MVFSRAAQFYESAVYESAERSFKWVLSKRSEREGCSGIQTWAKTEKGENFRIDPKIYLFQLIARRKKLVRRTWN